MLMQKLKYQMYQVKKSYKITNIIKNNGKHY